MQTRSHTMRGGSQAIGSEPVELEPAPVELEPVPVSVSPDVVVDEVGAAELDPASLPVALDEPARVVGSPVDPVLVVPTGSSNAGLG